MSREETTIIVLTLGALVAYLAWFTKPPAVIEEGEAAVAYGATNLTLNQPFMFAPPVANILPQQAASQLGQPMPTSEPYYSATYGCGCN